MSKINLEQMNKDLYPEVCYKQLKELDETIKRLTEMNSFFTVNKSELTKRIAVTVFGDSSTNYSKENNKDRYFQGLKNILLEKKALIEKLRLSASEIEKEIVFQDEAIGSYEQLYKKSLSSD